MNLVVVTGHRCLWLSIQRRNLKSSMNLRLWRLRQEAKNSHAEAEATAASFFFVPQLPEATMYRHAEAKVGNGSQR